MNIKRKNPALSTTIYEKRPRRTYSLEEKLEMINLSEQGERNCDIARAFGIRESTLRTIFSQADKIKRTYEKLALPSSSSTTTVAELMRTKINLMDDMENELISWINEQIDQNLEVNSNKIRDKAIRIYNELKISNNGVQGRPFVASDAWLERFKKRANLDCLTTNESDNNSNSSTTNPIIINESFSVILKRIIDEDGYEARQVFCLDETELYWKRIPCSDDMMVKYNDEMMKDRLSLMFCTNANGDLRLKPLVVYHQANPKVLDGYSKDHLPVVWRSHPQTTITTNIFIDYFCNRLTNDLKDYCTRENLQFKILLILSNKSSIHSSYLMDLSENIRVVSVPKIPTIHPLKQGVIGAFKANYIRRIYLKLIEFVDDDSEQLDLDQFWQNFTIKHSIDLINDAWNDISSICLNRSWHLLWPDCLHDCKVLDSVDDLIETKNRILILAQQIGFKNIDIDKYIDDDCDNNCNDTVEIQTPQIRTLTVDVLREAFKNIQNVIRIFDDNDPDRERSAKIIKNIENAVLCYKQIYNEKKRAARQLTSTNLSNQTLFPINGVIKLENQDDNFTL